jgi:hypothetical protein
MTDGQNMDGLLDTCEWLAATPAAISARVCASIMPEPTQAALWDALNWAQAALGDTRTRTIAIRVGTDEAYASQFAKALIAATEGMYRKPT